MSSIFRREDIVQALSGGQGGLCAIVIALPIESVQKMQGTAEGKPPSVGECVRRIMADGGVKNFYRGIVPLVIQGFVEKFCYFLPYSVIVFYYERRFGSMGCKTPDLPRFFSDTSLLNCGAGNRETLRRFTPDWGAREL
jgi:hypothetical protein